MKIIKTLYNKLISKYPGCVNCAYFDDNQYDFMCNVCENGRNLYMDKYFKRSIHIEDLKIKCNECTHKNLCNDRNKVYCYEKLLRDYVDHTFSIIEKQVKELE